MKLTEKHYKQRVNFQVGSSIELDDDEVGSYMLFYIIGKNVRTAIEEVVETLGVKRVFNQQCAQALLDMGIYIVVKAGTTANRKSDRYIDPFSIRGREILNELGQCFQGVFQGADIATRKAYDILSSNVEYECQAIMVAHTVHDRAEYSTDIEERVANYVLKKYGLSVENKVSMHKPRSTERWGREKVAVSF
jgi:hypothetical protein